MLSCNSSGNLMAATIRAFAPPDPSRVTAQRAVWALQRRAGYKHAFYKICTMIYTLFMKYTAISIKAVHEQSGKVEYERKRLLGTALKIH
jgi:uncharacterized protein with GYD domain